MSEKELSLVGEFHHSVGQLCNLLFAAFLDVVDKVELIVMWSEDCALFADRLIAGLTEIRKCLRVESTLSGLESMHTVFGTESYQNG